MIMTPTVTGSLGDAEDESVGIFTRLKYNFTYSNATDLVNLIYSWKLCGFKIYGLLKKWA